MGKKGRENRKRGRNEEKEMEERIKVTQERGIEDTKVSKKKKEMRYK